MQLGFLRREESQYVSLISKEGNFLRDFWSFEKLMSDGGGGQGGGEYLNLLGNGRSVVGSDCYRP